MQRTNSSSRLFPTPPTTQDVTVPSDERIADQYNRVRALLHELKNQPDNKGTKVLFYLEMHELHQLIMCKQFPAAEVTDGEVIPLTEKFSLHTSSFKFPR